MEETHVIVSLYWGGGVVYEAGSVRYNRRPQVVQRFPISLKYDRLQCIFRSKMAVSDPELKVVITGRYPNSFLANGFPIYGEAPIYDDGSLSSFLRSPEIFSNHIIITMLEMYATVERLTQVEEPTDNEFDFNVGDTTYIPSLVHGNPRGAFQQQKMVGVGSHSKDTSGFGTQYDRVASTHYRDFDWSVHNREIGGPSVHNREIGGPSNALVLFQNSDRSARHPENPGTNELVGGSSNQHHPAQLESIDRCNDFEDDPTLIQLTGLVNNNDVANDEVNELDSDVPLDYEATDDDLSSGGDGNSDKDVAPPGEGPKDFACLRDTDHIQAAHWNQKKPGFIRSGMLFQNKQKMKAAVRLYSLHHRKEFISDQLKGKSWRVFCNRYEQGCQGMIRFREISGGMWKAGKMIEEHNCSMDAYREEDHSNLDNNTIAIALIPSITINPHISIKDVQFNIKRLYKFTPSKRKASQGRKQAFEMVFGDFESSFKALPRYMAALQYFNPGTVVEWEHQSTTMQGDHIFKYLFWAFKPSINGFKSCRPVISIDSTHVYGKYEMKLLIAVAIDANNNIFPLAYAVVARESYDSWSWFLQLLWKYVVCDRQQIGLISDHHQYILQCVQTYVWLQPPVTYHRFCIRHLKNNFNKKFLNSDLENLMWLAATEHQKKKCIERMVQIKTLSHAAHLWLANHPVEKWTMHKDDGRRWGALTTNVSESYNGLLKKARGLPITAIVRLTFKTLVDRFVERSTLATALIERKEAWPTTIRKKFEEYKVRAQMHTDCMNYNTEDGIFEILTFAHVGKGGNVHIVNHREKQCSCGKWRNYHMPCSHAIRSSGIRGIDPSNYVSEYYSCRLYKQTYSGKFSPLGEEAYWLPSPFSLLANTKYERTSGVQYIAPSRMARRCGNCKQTGHNKTRCPELP